MDYDLAEKWMTKIAKLESELAQYKQLAKAQAEGRLVVLPCEVGDMVKAEVVRPYNGHKLTIHGEIVDIETVVRVKHSGCRYIDFMVDDFGKTVFLDREAAEKALGGKEDV